MQSFPNNISGCYLKRIEQAEYFHSTPLKQKHYFKRISITNLLSVFHRTASCKLIENKPIINNNVVWWCPWLNCAHSGMLWKISSLCTSLRTKSSLTIKTDDITSSRRDVDLHIQAVTGDSGENGLMRSAFHLTKTSENLETVANGMEIPRENFQKVPESLNFWNANHSTKSCKVMWRTKHANVRAVSCGFVYHKLYTNPWVFSSD